MKFPCDELAEEAVLGHVVVSGRGLDLDLEADDFHVPANRVRFEAMLRIAGRGEAIDLVGLDAELRRRNELSVAGGLDGLNRLSDAFLAGPHLELHVRRLRHLADVRRIQRAALEVADVGVDADPDFAAFAERTLLAASRGRTPTREHAPRSLTKQFYDQQAARLSGVFRGASTRHVRLNEVLAGGIQAGELSVIAARPGMGKTAFMLDLATHAAVPQSRDRAAAPGLQPTLFFSLEMGVGQLLDRLFANEAAVDGQAIRRPQLLDDLEARRLVGAGHRIAGSRLHIDDSGILTPAEIARRVRRFRARRDLFPEGDEVALIIVDYLQLVRPSRRTESREQDVAQCTADLKALAKDEGIALLVGAQLNRKVDDRADHRPQLSDLRESGSIENDGDLILFLYRHEKYFPPDPPPPAPPAVAPSERRRHDGLAEIIVGKQRNGPLDTIEARFAKRLMRFEDLEFQRGAAA